MALAERENIGPYRLIRLLRGGHTCLIWEGARDEDDKRVAIKIVKDELRSRRQANELRHEFNVGRNLRHQRVVRCIQFDFEWNAAAKVPFLVTELFGSRNLKQAIHDGVDNLAFYSQQIIEQAAEGLEYFHGQGWVHRDVKPDNFMLDDEGNVKLIDYALARKKRLLPRILGRRSKVQGTRSYMSPEQIRDQRPDPRSDIYSFGCFIFHLLGGRPPYTSANANDLLNKHIKAPIPSLLALNANVTDDVVRLVSCMMAKRSEHRPQTLTDFLDEFRKIKVFRTRPKRPGLEERK